jgi:actin-related protein
VGDDALDYVQRYTGDDAKPIYPIQRGHIVNLDAMYKVWNHIYKNVLRVDPTQYPVLLTIPPLTTPETKAAITKMFFRTFKVPSLTITNQAVLSLFSTGRTTGIVLEVGEGVSHAVPVYEGFCLNHAVQRLPVGGLDVSKVLMKMLQERGVPVRDAQLDIVRDIKETVCAVQIPGDSNQKLDPDEMTYELPGGQIIAVDEECCFSAPEVLFSPETNAEIFNSITEHDHDRATGLHNLLFDSIMMCDSYLQQDLFRNIVLAGGSSMLPFFGDRVRRELAGMVDSYQYTQVVTDSQRGIGAWIGGSMYASLPTFSQIKITLQEYQNDSSGAVVLEKSF